MTHGELDTINDSFVSVSGDDIVFVIPPGRMSKAKALRCAAWLFVLADGELESFRDLVKAIERT